MPDENHHSRVGSQIYYTCTIFFLKLNSLGLLHERGFACQTLRLCLRKTSFSIPRSHAFGLAKIWTFFHPTICLLFIFCWVSNLLLDSAAVGGRRSEYLSRCEREGEVAFSWPRAQRRGLVFPAVSDCSGPAECKHALMCGAALDTEDTAQTISAHELRPDRLSLCSAFPSLKFPPTSQAPFCHDCQCEIDILQYLLIFKAWFWSNGNFCSLKMETQSKQIFHSSKPLRS